MAQLFTLTSPAIPPNAAVRGFRGTEALSQLYRFEVALTLPDVVDVELEGAAGTTATLSIDRGLTAPPYILSGILASLELAHEYGGQSLLIATLVPTMHRLRLQRHSRVFTEMSIPEVVSAVLARSGVAGEKLELALSYAYPVREHVCQYRETDLDFVQRLLEKEGIYYFFKQTEQGEVLVLTDHLGAHTSSRGPVPYHALHIGDHMTQEAFATFRHAVHAMPLETTERDYDYLRPKQSVEGRAQVDAGGAGAIVAFGETGHLAPEAKRHAIVRAEELRSQGSTYVAVGRVYDLRTGFFFAVEGHPRPPMNQTYLATAIEHTGNDSSGYKDVEELLGLTPDEPYLVRVRAQPKNVQYRPPRVTPWPRIDGAVEGTVDGPAESPYAQLDENGRYRVRIHFDEEHLPDGKASMWIRMLQPHAGTPEGFHFPLRKHTEVHIIFVGGDPDRPVILGAIPNALTPSVVTSKNQTQNVIMTGGSNRIEIEDTAGKQYIHISSPTLSSYLHLGAGKYNVALHTDGNALNDYGVNFDVKVGGNKTEEVKGTVSEEYDSTLTQTVHGTVTKEFLSALHVSVSSDANYDFNSGLTKHVAGHTKGTLDSGLDITITGARNETTDGNHVNKTSGTYTTYSGPMWEAWADGDFKMTAAGGNGLVSAHGTLSLEASGDIEETAATINVIAGGTLQLKGGTVIVNGGPVTINGGDVTVNGGTMTVNGTTNVNGATTVTGATTVDGTLHVTQATTMDAPLSQKGGADMSGGIIRLNC